MMVAWAMPTISQTFYRRGGFHIRPVCGEGRYKICPYEISQIVGKATPRRCDEMRTVPRHTPKSVGAAARRRVLAKEQEFCF